MVADMLPIIVVQPARTVDIGTGLPTADNTHEVAQRVAPPRGACAYVEGELRDPDKILAEAAVTLDLAQPVALMLPGVL